MESKKRDYIQSIPDNSSVSVEGCGASSAIWKYLLLILVKLHFDRSDISYIRCLKPNATKGSTTFDPQFVLHQMRCVGLLETVRVRKSGFSLRMPFDQFYQRWVKEIIVVLICFRYGCVAGAVGAGVSLDYRTQCSIFLKQVSFLKKQKKMLTSRYYPLSFMKLPLYTNLERLKCF